MNAFAKFWLAAVLIVSVSALGKLSAADVTLTKTQPTGTDWNNASYWSNNAAPTADNDYFVTGGYALRSPENTSGVDVNVFAGGSLTIGNNDSTGTFAMKATGQTVSNLILHNGIISNAKAPNAIVTLAGSVTVTGTNAKIESRGNPDTRSLYLRAKISGANGTTLTYETGSAASKIWVLNPDNDFAGTVVLFANSHTYLYNDGNTTDTVGKLGADTVSLVTNSGSKLHVNADQTFSSWTTNYYSATQVREFDIPNGAYVVETKADQDALAVAGISAQIGDTITITNSTRTAQTYYLTEQAWEDAGWDQTGAWAVGSATGEVSTNIPTLGDTVHVAYTMRTRASTSAVTQNLLGTIYIDAGGSLGLKNAGSTIVNIPDLVLNGGGVGNWKEGNTTSILTGNILVETKSSVTHDPNRSVEIRSTITGTADLNVTVNNGTATRSNLILTADNSGYTGRFLVGARAQFETTADNALGRGGFSTAGNNKIILGGAQSVQAIDIAGTDANTITVKDSLAATTVNITGTTTTFDDAGGTLSFGTLNIDPGSTYTQGDFKSTVTFANGFSAETLRLKSSNVVVTGGDVVIGKDDLSTSLWVPTVGEIYTASGNYKVALDLSGATSSTIQVDHFEIVTSTSGPNAVPFAEVTLAPKAMIRANSLSIASSNATGLYWEIRNNILTLGADTTTIAVDDIYVGGGTFYNEDGGAIEGTKGQGTIQAVANGKVTLTGTDGVSAANMYVGSALIWTGGGGKGVVDLRGITEDSVINLNQLSLARKSSDAGSAIGIFSMDAGTVNVETLTLATSDNTGTTAAATFNLEGGTLNVKNVLQGTNTGKEVVNFNFTNGTLNVENWGTSDIPLALNQEGGSLTTSAEEMMIYGNYIQTAGRLLLDLGMQKVIVNGELALKVLAVDIADEFFFDENALYEVAQVQNVEDFVLEDYLNDLVVVGEGLLEEYQFSHAILGTSLYVGTLDAVSAAVPEPSSWMILLLGTAALLGMRRYRKQYVTV
ncbi:MAG: PEP-CTERM sorting domain-containing protein [Planctomycetia bacterium]|nr:PEP-CTERM sorting domain-containing protein [Planctomycetia bacterium]